MTKATTVEYPAPDSDEIWRVNRFDWLASEFRVEAGKLAAFHAIAAAQPRPWQIIRLLYGVRPVLLPVGTDAEYLREWKRAEIAAHLGIPVPAIRDDLDYVKLVWRKHARKLARSVQAAEMAVVKESLTTEKETAPPVIRAPRAPRKARVEKVGGDALNAPPPDDFDEVILPPMEDARAQALLTLFGFGDDIFAESGRSEVEAVAERDWFAGRLNDLRKMFEEPRVSTLARQAIINEMIIRRLDARLCRCVAGSGLFATIQETKQAVEAEYRIQWAKINDIFPWASEAASKVRVTGVLGDFVQGVQQYMADGDNRILDGVRTAFEIQVDMRESQQLEIRYRPGQAAAIREAIDHLLDPEYKRLLPDYICRMMDEGFREGARRVREQLGLTVPDLEDDGPKGEYPPLFDPNKADPKLAGPEEPSENIELVTDAKP